MGNRLGSWVFVAMAFSFLVVFGCSDDSPTVVVSADSISITSVTPATATEGVATEFTIVTEYTLESKTEGEIGVGFNTFMVNGYSILDTAIVPQGSGTETFTVSATPVDWGAEGDFEASANLSEYPHGSSWSPLVSTSFPITVTAATSGLSSPELLEQVPPEIICREVEAQGGWDCSEK